MKLDDTPGSACEGVCRPLSVGVETAVSVFTIVTVGKAGGTGHVAFRPYTKDVTVRGDHEVAVFS